MGAVETLLTVAFRHEINAPTLEAGYERFAALTDHRIDYGTFCAAVAAGLQEGLIHEPVRLPEGALQCHWHLELTPKGVAATRCALGQGQNKPSMPKFCVA